MSDFYIINQVTSSGLICYGNLVSDENLTCKNILLSERSGWSMCICHMKYTVMI